MSLKQEDEGLIKLVVVIAITIFLILVVSMTYYYEKNSAAIKACEKFTQVEEFKSCIEVVREYK